MKPNSRLLIMLLSLGALLLLPPPPQRVYAQYPADQCIQSFFSEYESPCANCCNNPSVQIDAIDTTGNTSRVAHLSRFLRCVRSVGGPRSDSPTPHGRLDSGWRRYRIPVFLDRAN